MRYSIDEKDRRIMDILREHGDYSTRQIAKKTLIPTTTINNRIRKLKSEKIIKKVTIEVDHKKVDKGFMAYILISADLLSLKQKKRTQYDIVQELKRYDFVERADIVSGGTDIIAMVRVKDVEEYDEVLLKKIQMIDGIANTQSLTVIHEG